MATRGENTAAKLTPEEAAALDPQERPTELNERQPNPDNVVDLNDVRQARQEALAEANQISAQAQELRQGASARQQVQLQEEQARAEAAEKNLLHQLDEVERQLAAAQKKKKAASSVMARAIGATVRDRSDIEAGQYRLQGDIIPEYADGEEMPAEKKRGFFGRIADRFAQGDVNRWNAAADVEEAIHGNGREGAEKKIGTREAQAQFDALGDDAVEKRVKALREQKAAVEKKLRATQGMLSMFRRGERWQLVEESDDTQKEYESARAELVADNLQAALDEQLGDMDQRSATLNETQNAIMDKLNQTLIGDHVTVRRAISMALSAGAAGAAMTGFGAGAIGLVATRRMLRGGLAAGAAYGGLAAMESRSLANSIKEKRETAGWRQALGEYLRNVDQQDMKDLSDQEVGEYLAHAQELAITRGIRPSSDALVQALLAESGRRVQERLQNVESGAVASALGEYLHDADQKAEEAINEVRKNDAKRKLAAAAGASLVASGALFKMGEAVADLVVPEAHAEQLVSGVEADGLRAANEQVVGQGVMAGVSDEAASRLADQGIGLTPSGMKDTAHGEVYRFPEGSQVKFQYDGDDLVVDVTNAEGETQEYRGASGQEVMDKLADAESPADAPPETDLPKAVRANHDTANTGSVGEVTLQAAQELYDEGFVFSVDGSALIDMNSEDFDRTPLPSDTSIDFRYAGGKVLLTETGPDGAPVTYEGSTVTEALAQRETAMQPRAEGSAAVAAPTSSETAVPSRAESPVQSAADVESVTAETPETEEGDPRQLPVRDITSKRRLSEAQRANVQKTIDRWKTIARESGVTQGDGANRWVEYTTPGSGSMFILDLDSNEMYLLDDGERVPVVPETYSDVSVEMGGSSSDVVDATLEELAPTPEERAEFQAKRGKLVDIVREKGAGRGEGQHLLVLQSGEKLLAHGDDKLAYSNADGSVKFNQLTMRAAERIGGIDELAERAESLAAVEQPVPDTESGDLVDDPVVPEEAEPPVDIPEVAKPVLDEDAVKPEPAKVAVPTAAVPEEPVEAEDVAEEAVETESSVEQYPDFDRLAKVIHEESGGRPGIVSKDTYGYSYGLFQFNSRPDAPDAMEGFMQWAKDDPLIKQLNASGPVNSASFRNTFTRLAEQNPTRMSELQIQYYDTVHLPQLYVDVIKEAGVDPRGFSEPVRSLIDGSVNQYGSYLEWDDIFSGDVKEMSDEDIIRAIQAHKRANIEEDFPCRNSTATERANIQAGVRRRINDDEEYYLGIVQGRGGGYDGSYVRSGGIDDRGIRTYGHRKPDGPIRTFTRAEGGSGDAAYEEVKQFSGDIKGLAIEYRSKPDQELVDMGFDSSLPKEQRMAALMAYYNNEGSTVWFVPGEDGGPGEVYAAHRKPANAQNFRLLVYPDRVEGMLNGERLRSIDDFPELRSHVEPPTVVAEVESPEVPVDADGKEIAPLAEQPFINQEEALADWVIDNGTPYGSKYVVEIPPDGDKLWASERTGKLEWERSGNRRLEIHNTYDLHKIPDIDDLLQKADPNRDAFDQTTEPVDAQSTAVASVESPWGEVQQNASTYAESKTVSVQAPPEEAVQSVAGQAALEDPEHAQELKHDIANPQMSDDDERLRGRRRRARLAENAAGTPIPGPDVAIPSGVEAKAERAVDRLNEVTTNNPLRVDLDRVDQVIEGARIPGVELSPSREMEQVLKIEDELAAIEAEVDGGEYAEWGTDYGRFADEVVDAARNDLTDAKAILAQLAEAEKNDWVDEQNALIVKYQEKLQSALTLLGAAEHPDRIGLEERTTLRKRGIWLPGESSGSKMLAAAVQAQEAPSEKAVPEATRKVGFWLQQMLKSVARADDVLAGVTENENIIDGVLKEVSSNKAERARALQEFAETLDDGDRRKTLLLMRAEELYDDADRYVNARENALDAQDARDEARIEDNTFTERRVGDGYRYTQPYETFEIYNDDEDLRKEAISEVLAPGYKGYVRDYVNTGIGPSGTSRETAQPTIEVWDGEGFSGDIDSGQTGLDAIKAVAGDAVQGVVQPGEVITPEDRLIANLEREAMRIYAAMNDVTLLERQMAETDDPSELADLELKKRAVERSINAMVRRVSRRYGVNVFIDSDTPGKLNRFQRILGSMFGINFEGPIGARDRAAFGDGGDVARARNRYDE